MLRIIAGISRRTISLSRPVLVAERNEMKNLDMLPSGTRGSHNPDGFSFQKSDLIKAIQSHLTDALVEVTDTSDGCGSNFNIQVYLPDILSAEPWLSPKKLTETTKLFISGHKRCIRR